MAAYKELTTKYKSDGDPRGPRPQLDEKHDSDGNFKGYYNYLKNTVLAVQWLDAIIYDRASMRYLVKRDFYTGRPLKHYVNMTDGHKTDVKLAVNQIFGYVPKDCDFEDALRRIRMYETINPLIDKWEECYKNWDHSQGHIARLLEYVGAKHDLTPEGNYNVNCLRMHLVAAITRQYTPGYKYDTTIILAGNQGLGKSTFVSRLAMDSQYVNENLQGVSSKDDLLAIRGKIFVCLDELCGVTKQKEQEAVKSFLTRTSDYYREPFAKTPQDVPRQCVFWGTSNKAAFLRDATGDRRYLPIRCSTKREKDMWRDAKEFEEEIKQAWGEAMALYKAANGAPNLILSETTNAFANKLRQEYTEEDTRIGVIQDYLDRMHEGDRVCVRQLAIEALSLDRLDSKTTAEIHEIMRHKIGKWDGTSKWQPAGKQRCGSYGVQMSYTCFQAAERETADSSAMQYDHTAAEFWALGTGKRAQV